MPLDAFLTGPLVIDTIATPSGGRIGLTHAPGRTGLDARGRDWRRRLDDDLATIEEQGVGLMISLIEAQEFAALGVPHFAETAAARRFDWKHFPIVDMAAPTTDERLRALLDDVEAVLAQGGLVLFHCAAGLGRTGAMAAFVLIDRLGFSAEDAIALVRSVRPGTIESDAQLRFLQDATRQSAP